MKKLDPLIILLALSGFLATLSGGYILVEETRLEPSLSSLITAIFAGVDAPVLSHLVIALPVAIVMVVTLLQRRILQLPNPKLGVCLVTMTSALAVSLLFSDFKVVTGTLILEWGLYGLAFYTVVAAAGRKTGPVAILGSIGAGTAWVAIRGILEYAQVRAENPSWRIFAGWVNPNAVAAMYLIGFFCLLGLALTQDRLVRLVSILGAAMILFALVLTGSKGGVALGLPIGILALASVLRPGERRLGWYGVAGILGVVVAFMFLKNMGYAGLLVSLIYLAASVGMSADRNTLGPVLAPFVLATLLVAGISATTPPAAAPKDSAAPVAASSPIARVATGSQNEDQSATFRLNLWKSAVSLIKDRPVFGFGLGTYRFESARPGLTTQTIFAHNSYLQLWAEAGIGAVGAFLAAIVLWFGLVLRRVDTLVTSQRSLLAVTVAAVLALLVHGLVDSDFSYFGIGITVFMLMGVGLLLSADSVAPEFVPRVMRNLVAGAIAVWMVVFFGAGMLDVTKASYRFLETPGREAELLQARESLASYVNVDGDAAYLHAKGATPNQRTEELQRAYSMYPSSNVGRSLATMLDQGVKANSAVAILTTCLERDPNNLRTLSLLANIQQRGGYTKEALETARRLIAVEDTPYFKIRSIPENVPTETYLARFDILAPAETEPKAKLALLTTGVKGMLSYADVTVKRILVPNTAKDPSFRYAGETLAKAREKLTTSQRAANEAARLYRVAGDATGAAEMEAAAAFFAAAIPADLSSK